MKKLFLFTLLFATLASYAQNTSGKKTDWGFKIGLNGSNLRVENGTNSDWKTGLAAGFFFNFKYGQNCSIQPELLYSSMGGKNFLGEDETSLRLNYFSLPVLLQFKPLSKLAVFAGPQIDVMIQAKTKNTAGFDKVTDEFKENSFAATGGLSYWPTHCFGLSARYIYGLNNIANTDLVKLKNQGVQVMAAVKF